jgi:hypothetical protein
VHEAINQAQQTIERAEQKLVEDLRSWLVEQGYKVTRDL